METDIYVWIGKLTALYIGVLILKQLYEIFRVYFYQTYPDFSKYGDWSVITGSTDGIGKAIALQLASKGQNIILIARNREKLKTVAQEIELKFQVKTKYLQIDFTEDESIYEKLKDFLEDLNIGVLINNVAVSAGGNKFLDFENLSILLRNVTRANIFNLFKMHQLVLPGMVQRKRGLIVNISSASCLRYNKYFSIYGASKAFTNYFSQVLAHEYADDGISIQTCLPFFVKSNMTRDYPMYDSMLTSESYAASLLSTVDKQSVTHGCWQHKLQSFVMKFIPLSLLHDWAKKNLVKEQYSESKHKFK